MRIKGRRPTVNHAFRRTHDSLSDPCIKWAAYAMILAGAFFLASQASVAQGKGKGKKKAAKKAQVDKKGAKKPGKKGKGKKAAGTAAKEKAPAEMKDPKAMAKESYNNGKKYYKKNDYKKALESFMAAYNYAPNPFVYISIAQCYDKLGMCQEARDYYKKYMEEKPDAGNIPDIKEKIAELESRKGKVSIVSDPAGATVTIDGETTDMVTPASVKLQGGDHALAMNLDGYIMETRAFTVPICGDVEISVTLKSAQPITTVTTGEKIDAAIKEMEKKEKKPKRKIKLGIPHYVSFGLAGAALITAAVTGGLALRKSNDFDDKKDEYEGNPSSGLYDDMEDLKSSGRSLAIACDVTIGVAAVAAVTGIALLFLVPKEKKKVAVIPLLSSKGGGASLSLNF